MSKPVLKGEQDLTVPISNFRTKSVLIGCNTGELSQETRGEAGGKPAGTQVSLL